MNQTSQFEIVDNQNECLAIIIRRDFSPGQTTFVSKNEYSQQLGIIKYPKDGKIQPHFHNELPREVVITQEVLVIRKGKVRVDLYDGKLEFVRSVELERGDAILLVSGGHGFHMLEDSEMLEIKQGPYMGRSNDKTTFEGSRQ